VLDGLDEIPWQLLHHAYGTAEDVPVLLRALARSDSQVDALYELFGNIWHQGTVYEASSFAVPFLFELVADPTIARRDEIMGLIGALANGESYLAVHAQSGLKSGEFWRQKQDFEERLETEQEGVRRTRAAVLEKREVTCRLLKDAMPMVRAGAAYVMSRFPEHVSHFGPLIRQAVREESQSLARAAMLWCLGAIRDVSPDAQAMLDVAAREDADPRQAFAASIALYCIKGQPHAAHLPIYRQMSAARWFVDDYLTGVPWDFSNEASLEALLANVEPDPIGATRALLIVLEKAERNSDVYSSVVRDLLYLNFDKGNWRQCKQLTVTQVEVLRRLVRSDAWLKDTKRLWFLVPDGAKRTSQLEPSDIQNARKSMESVLDRSDTSSSS
jgi:hypothetical protein